MKAFLLGVVAAAAIGVAAHYGLRALEWDSARAYSVETVRLSPSVLPRPDGTLRHRPGG